MADLSSFRNIGLASIQHVLHSLLYVEWNFYILEVTICTRLW